MNDLAAQIAQALRARGLKTEMPPENEQCPEIPCVHVIVGAFLGKCYSLEDAQHGSWTPPVDEFFRLASKLDFKRFYCFARDASEAWWAACRQDPFSVTGRIFRTGNQEFTLLAEIEDCRPETARKKSDFRCFWTYNAPHAFESLNAVKAHLQALVPVEQSTPVHIPAPKASAVSQAKATEPAALALPAVIHPKQAELELS
jgi:hypothetical protein